MKTTITVIVEVKPGIAAEQLAEQFIHHAIHEAAADILNTANAEGKLKMYEVISNGRTTYFGPK